MKHIRTLEEWKDIKGYEGIYQVSDLGRVKSLERIDAAGHKRKERILKGGADKDGYLYVCLNGKHKLVHRLVAEAFVPNPDNLSEVNHCNERKDDNKAFNLEWCTHKENMNYGTNIERAKARCKPVFCKNTNTTYPSATEAEKQTGVSRQSISSCCNGKTKTAGGMEWIFIGVTE